MTNKKRERLWKMHDALMKRWDTIDGKADELFEQTHPWLFNPTLKPEIIETEETLKKEKQIERELQEVFSVLQKVSKELFPKKPVIITQGELNI